MGCTNIKQPAARIILQLEHASDMCIVCKRFDMARYCHVDCVWKRPARYVVLHR